MTVVWSFPTRVLFGEGSVAEAGAELARTGGTRALVVTDQGVVDAGLIDRVAGALRGKKITYEVFSALSSNPTEKEVLAAIEAYKSSGADSVIAVGGGSPLDTGKLVRLGATHPLPLAQYDDTVNGGDLIVHAVPPMVAVPTTAGTGSEVGRSGVVTIEATNRKTVIFAPRLMPSVAILDPVMTSTMPPKTTAATGFDALTHCIEAYCSQGDHPMADAIALEGIELVAKNLELAVTEGTNLAARGAMMKAAMMGAVAFQKGLGACHSLAHPLSSEAHLHHGLANAICLPAVLDFNRSAIPVKIARIARILGVRADDVESLAFECSGAIRSLRHKVGLPEGLAAAGVEEGQLATLAQLAVEDGCHNSNPRPCTKNDMMALYRASL